MTESESLSAAVLEQVAAAEGVEPEELPSLYDAIDPDALDALFAGRDGSRAAGTVVFPYAGYEITVHDDGTVEVE